jgi:outer membrane protein assembly factor BamB
VTSDFAAGEVITIEGLAFRSFTAPAPQDFLGLEAENDGVASVFDDKTIDIFPDGVPTLSSDADQMFLVGSAPVANVPFTISEGNAPLIRAGTDVRVRIPVGFNMTWNPADTIASVAGSASSKVSATVSYEDLDGTLVLDVLTDFAPGDFVTVTGLSFASFTAVSSADELELEVDDLGSVIDLDDKRIFVDGSTDVSIFAATARDSEVELQWVFPDAGACDFVIIRRGVGSFPGPGGTPIDDVPCTGLMGMPYSSTDLTAANGVEYYYSAFVDNGPGYTAGKFVKARPFDTSGSVQWAYSTAATSMAPPGLKIDAGNSYVYVVSNDGILHGLNGDASGGDWISGFIPNDLGAPAQARPPVVSFPVGGSPAAAFLSSQDGVVHAINATDGSTEWTQAISTMVQAAPAGHFSAFSAGATDLLLVGTRNASAANSLEALRFDTGLPQWSFVNDLVQGDGKEIGVISGGASIDYGNQRIYFASRTRPGSTATLWGIDFTPALLWKAALGNIDGSPVRYDGRVYVGNNAGVVHAVDAGSGAPQWSRALGDGPVKGFVFPKLGSSILFVSTNNKVWAIEDKIGSGDVVPGWPVAITSPSFPLHPPGSPYVIVGSGDGKLYQIDLASPSTPASVILGPGTAAVGAPTLDIVKSMIYVGTEAGIIYGVLYPIF